jgi:CheY-like chemotaxis protein
MIGLVKRGCVLLAEDEENDAFFFQRAFRKAGFENPVHHVHDGLETIQYLAGEGDYADRTRFPYPILLVLDLNMPRRHGLDVLRWIRAQPELRPLVIVVLTSSSSEVDLAATNELGVNSYVVKPAEPDRYVEAIQLLASYWLRLNCAPELRLPNREDLCRAPCPQRTPGK